MEVTTSIELYIRRAVVGALIIGVSLASVISGRTPGPFLYGLSATLAGVYVATAMARIRSTGWIGVLAYALLMAAFLSAGKSGLPGMLAGLVIAILTVLPRPSPVEDDDAQAQVVEGPHEADADLDRFHNQTDL